METRTLDDLLDQLVAEYADRAARGPSAGEPRSDDLLARVPEAHRDALERCFRMIRAGTGSAPSASAPLGPGARLANFEIVRELGRGGMAVVYLATQIDLKRPVALKVLRPGLAFERRHVDRFRREALAVARLKHPHIVQVHAVGEERGWHFLAMEYVDGKTLADVYSELAVLQKPGARDLARLTGMAPPQDGEPTFEQALCQLLAPVARALGVAHEIGIVHRDVKPSNVLIHKDGRAVIADFGLAKGDGDPDLSLTGEPLGTPFYMSPEQVELADARVDRRTDVYSLGVTLFEGLTGRRPFEGATVLAVLEAVRRGTTPSVRARMRGRSRDAEAVVCRAMEKDRAERYPDALELAVDLQSIAQRQPTQARLRKGSAPHRALVVIGILLSGKESEYRSRAEWLGWPLVHVVRPVAGGRKVAKGWIAIGNKAVGLVAVGNLALGALALGGFSLGLLSLGGFAIGALAIGGFAAGYDAIGGFAAGFSAIGGMAWGYYAMGGKAVGVHTISALARDPVAIEWFRPWLPWITWLPGFEALAKLFEA